MEDFTNLYKILKTYMQDIEIDEINRAFLFSSKAHESQIRKSGEAYIIHPLAVSIILANQKLPKEVIIGALLHDVVEDTEYVYEDIEENFSKEIADIVEGVTKLGDIEEFTYDQIQAENHRKILVSAAKDIRVLLIKLSDRLHNMRTISHMNQEKQKLIANETMEVYAPIAHRLGMYEMKWELEDLSFKCLNPQKYKEIASMIELKRSEREKIVEATLSYVEDVLQKNNIDAVIKGRSKHIYSIYRKMETGKHFDEITDLFAFRVVVNTIPQCYIALGAIHENFKPIPMRFKDYIPTPKHNFYQSIHTTVLTKQGVSMEFQIRTEKMNYEAEYGIASHWMYKERKSEDEFQEGINQKLTWLRKLLEEGEGLENSQQFMNKVKDDYLSKSIFVFTPRGDIIELPNNSTVLDFAFFVHTTIGYSAISSKVNDMIVSLFYNLKMGDVVNIITSKHSQPSIKWMSRVKTRRAKESLYKYFKDLEKHKFIDEGREAILRLEKKINKKLDEPTLERIAQNFSKPSIEELYLALALGEVGYKEIFRYLTSDEKNEEKELKDVIIEGESKKYKIRYCKYCYPLPGDDIVAVPLESKEVTQYFIHKKRCLAVKKNIALAVFTDSAQEKLFAVRLEVLFKDKKGILSNVLGKISDNGANILNIYGVGSEQQDGLCKVTVELHNKKEYYELKKKILEIENVYDVHRIISKYS